MEVTFLDEVEELKTSKPDKRRLLTPEEFEKLLENIIQAMKSRIQNDGPQLFALLNRLFGEDVQNPRLFLSPPPDVANGFRLNP